MNETPSLDADSGHEPPVRKNVVVRRIVGWGISVGMIFLVVLMFLPVHRTAREAARRSQCKNNLKQIGLALHNYHDDYGAFPPAHTVDASGKPLHSWRVLLLPYLGQKDLYDKIDLTKAWNDPVNADARKAELQAFQCPSNSSPATHTNYVAIVGDEFAFSKTGARTIQEIKDGTSNTVMVTELPMGQTFEWMEPRDGGEEVFLSSNSKTPTSHEGGLHVLFGDGGVKFLSAAIPPDTRRALMTISGGEQIGEY